MGCEKPERARRSGRAFILCVLGVALAGGGVKAWGQATPELNPSTSGNSSSSSSGGSSSSAPDAAAQGLSDAVKRGQQTQAEKNQNAQNEEKAARHIAGLQANVRGASIQTDEAVFIMAAALNACGYDAGMEHPNPLRVKVRREMEEEIAASAEAQAARQKLCGFVRDHDMGEPGKTLGQYMSLALLMKPSADLELEEPMSQLPPDALRVVGMVPALQKFAAEARLHLLWSEIKIEYDDALQPLIVPLTKQILQLSLYLRLSEAGNEERRFVVIVEPMLAPGVVNARIYGLDYLMVLAPPQTEQEKARFEQDVRHFYLHFAVEPLIFGYPQAMLRLQPLMKAMREAPVDEVYREDVASLVSECLIRAIEARTMDTGLAPVKLATGARISDDASKAELQRQQQVEAIRVARAQRDTQEGFVLTKYFFDQLKNYERSNESLLDAVGAMVYGMDVDEVSHQAMHIQFVQATEEQKEPGLQRRAASLGKDVAADPLTDAEKQLSAGHVDEAIVSAQAVVDKKEGDTGRAMYLLAEAHAMHGDMEEAQSNFEQALTMTKDPHTLAWSHIYLGRIDDIKQDRPAAVEQYKAALKVKSDLPDAVAAAQQGLKEPYAVPKRSAPSSPPVSTP
jgi:tetratricopeptide (TPR) repeat protein